MSVVKTLILPPGALVAILILGWLLTLRRARVGRAVLLAGIALFWLLSTPLVGGALLDTVSLDTRFPKGKIRSGAIVVLGGTFNATEDGGEPGALTLERLARAAALHRELGLPILVSAGKLRHLSKPGAAIMARTLRDVFAVHVRWQETASTNTHENALETARILRKAPVNRALVVTHSWHLQRAMRAFARTQLDAIPVAVRVPSSANGPVWRDLLPTMGGLEASYYALYETLGLVWYMVRYQTP